MEGGGMRGIFAAGVLDAFSENDFNPFSLYIGVSAGACNLSSFIAGQYLRNYRIYTSLMTRPEFINVRKFLRGSHYMDLDFLWDSIDRHEPLDVPAMMKREGKDFIITATSAETGMPVYLKPTEENCLQCLKASSSVPVLYRHCIRIDGISLTDGGVADPIPVHEAYRRGARHIVVVRTRPPWYCKKHGMEARLMELFLKSWPELKNAIGRQAEIYRRCLDFIDSPPPGVRIAHIAPPDHLKTGRTTQILQHLIADYTVGKRMGHSFVRQWSP